MVCNNMCKTFNFAIISARDKLIITLLEMIRNYLMKRLIRKRKDVSKWTHLVGPKVFKFMKKVKLETAICQPHYLGNKVYQVECFGHDQFVVDLENRTSACRI